MQAVISLYFLVVLTGTTTALCRAGLRDLPRIGAALVGRDEPADGAGFWTRLALQHQPARSPALRTAQRSR